jgi:hypothetical protein
MKTLAFLTLFLGFAFAATAQEKKEEKATSANVATVEFPTSTANTKDKERSKMIQVMKMKLGLTDEQALQVTEILSNEKNKKDDVKTLATKIKPILTPQQAAKLDQTLVQQ